MLNVGTLIYYLPRDDGVVFYLTGAFLAALGMFFPEPKFLIMGDLGLCIAFDAFVPVR